MASLYSLMNVVITGNTNNYLILGLLNENIEILFFLRSFDGE